MRRETDIIVLTVKRAEKQNQIYVFLRRYFCLTN